jgi:ribosomal protein S21
MNLAEVRLQEVESLENTLRRFKRRVQTEVIIKEINNWQMPQEIWPI